MAPDSELKAKLAELVAIVPLGPEVIVVVGGDGVDREGPGRGGAGVGGGVGCPDREGVGALGEGAVALRRGAVRVGGAVELAFELAPDSELKAKLGRVGLIVPLGPEVIVVVGATVSTVKLRLAGEPVLVAESVARTEKVWEPSASEP